jgi:hypothetical protein
LDNVRTLVHGQKMYRDLAWNFSFWRPRNWHEAPLDGPKGVVIYPEDDPLTGFYVTVVDLDDTVGDGITKADLPALHEGLIEGLRCLPECELLRDEEIAKGQAVGYEFLLTFALNGTYCKQRLRILYTGHRQYTIYGQGSPPEEYDVFANIFDFMYMTLKFGDLLLDMDVPLMPDLTPTLRPKDPG